MITCNPVSLVLYIISRIGKIVSVYFNINLLKRSTRRKLRYPSTILIEARAPECDFMDYPEDFVPMIHARQYYIQTQNLDSQNALLYCEKH